MQRQARAFQPGGEPKAQAGQQRQQVGVHRLQRIDRNLQIINAFAQHLRHVHQRRLAMLYQPQRTHQRRAHAVVHVAHQALALVHQGLLALNHTQPLVAGCQLGLALGQALLDIRKNSR